MLTVILGSLAVTHSFAQALVKADPQTARMLAPYDARIVQEFAEAQFNLEPSGEVNSSAAQAAERAVSLDPTAATATVVLAMQAQFRGEVNRADRLFDYSQTLSRRELRTHIWALEKAVARGDIVGALRRYDMALRTSESASTLLFPVLSSAISEPKVRAALIDALREGAEWNNGFLQYVSERGTDPLAASRLYEESAQAGIAVSDEQRGAVVNALGLRGMFEDAWRFYSTMRKGATRNETRNSNFAAVVPAPTIFDWTVSDTPGLSATIQSSDGGLVDFWADAGTGGTVIEQTQLLSPGRYRVTSKSSASQSIGDRPDARDIAYWQVQCRLGNEIERLPLDISSQRGRTVSATFEVPQNCPVQDLSLVISRTVSTAGFGGQVSSVSLVPIR